MRMCIRVPKATSSASGFFGKNLALDSPLAKRVTK